MYIYIVYIHVYIYIRYIYIYVDTQSFVSHCRVLSTEGEGGAYFL